VTVLFADLVGFTSRAEQLDPEDVRAVLAPYWERLRKELERHGGTVEKFIGDAVMALFGAPVAHEDDPERAVRAALAIRDWARETDVQVRVAVTTGEALVQLGARPAEGEGMAAGDVVNTAARLQAAAPVNGVLVGESTYRATRDAIEYAEHAPVAAKGKTDPVLVWEALQARARFGMDLEQRTLLPLVGRRRELDVVVGAFDRARESLEPQLVTLVGVPGIGKSRLVAELFQRASDIPELVWWRQGRALPYGEGVSFWAVGEMVKAQAGIQENDLLEVARDKLWESLAAIDEDERGWVMQRLVPFVGGEEPASENRNEIFAAWRRYFESLAEQRPLVLVFEDLHWADDGLLDFIDHLVEWTVGLPLLVLATARPELLDRRPGWGGGKLNSTTLALSPLSDAEAATLFAHVLEQAVLPAETQQALLERAGGNPLYAEQFARLYVERGSAEDLPLPETIQGIIAARLDGLSPDEKRLLQAAAVVGKVFWVGAAAALAGVGRESCDDALHALERKGLIRRERRSSVGGETELAFRHVLVRDVAYGQVPRAAREARHLDAAAWIESLGRPDDHAELVAHHYEAALDLAAAAGAPPGYVQAAASAFLRAGDRAMRLGAFPVARRQYELAERHFYATAPEQPRAVLALARARFQTESDPDVPAAAADRLAEIGAIEEAVEASVLAAHALWRAGRLADGEAVLARAWSVLGDRTDTAAYAALAAEAGRYATFGNRIDEGEALCARAGEVAERLGLDDVRAQALNTQAVIAMIGGDLRRALELQKIVIDSTTSVTEQTRAITNTAVVYQSDLFGGLAEAYGRRGLTLAARTGDRINHLWARNGEILNEYYEKGRWDESLDAAHAFLDETENIGGHYLAGGVLTICARIYAYRGQRASALEDVDAAIGRIDLSNAQSSVPTLVESAEALYELGELDRARAAVDAALREVERSLYRAPGTTAASAVTMARLGVSDRWLRLSEEKFAQTGRVWAARLIHVGQAADAAELYAWGGSPLEEAVARLFAFEQLLERGRQAEAHEQLERALVFYRRAGATAVVARADAHLAAAS